MTGDEGTRPVSARRRRRPSLPVVVIACPPFDCPGGQAATILFSVSRISAAACPPGVEVGGSLTGVSNLIKKNEVFSFGNDFLECHWWVK